MEIKTLGQLCIKLTDIYKEKPFIVYRENNEWKTLSAKSALDRIYKLAMGLNAIGLKKGDMISLMSETRYEWTLLDFAMIVIGVINVPIYPTLTGEQAKYIIEHSESKAFIVSDNSILEKFTDFKKNPNLIKSIIIDGDTDENKNLISLKDLEKLGATSLKEKGVNYIHDIINKTKPDELASILYTSGTTGTPKGVMLSHNNFVSNAFGAFYKLDVSQYNNTLVFLPLSHSFARTCNYTLMLGKETLWYAEKLSTLGRDMVDSKVECLITVPRVFENVYKKVIGSVNEKGGISKKIFHWARKIAVKKTQMEQENKKISGFLKLKHKIADNLVYKKIVFG